MKPAFPQPPAVDSPRSRNEAPAPALVVDGLDLRLGGCPILRGIRFSVPATGVTTLIGPSGAGKSSLLRCLNRLHEHWQGTVRIFGQDVRHWPGGGDALRRRVGLIAQKAAVFPCSIRDNVVFGLDRRERRCAPADVVESALRRAALWREVADRLDAPATTLSIGQQQRLCLARALALCPSVLLLDEPTSSLDPRSKETIERCLLELAGAMPVLCVTHDMEQARRLGGEVIFLCDGRVMENGAAATFFRHPDRIESREFLRWSVCDCDDTDPPR